MFFRFARSLIHLALIMVLAFAPAVGAAPALCVEDDRDGECETSFKLEVAPVRPLARVRLRSEHAQRSAEHRPKRRDTARFVRVTAALHLGLHTPVSTPLLC